VWILYTMKSSESCQMYKQLHFVIVAL